MALTTCPDCGKEVSTSAQACPGCGRPMSAVSVTAKEVKARSGIMDGVNIGCGIFIVLPIIIIILLIALGSIGSAIK